tara:strand:+ start:502 stop:768 length:267 start_codon:yes stop_codon:yes gene_type:complete
MDPGTIILITMCSIYTIGFSTIGCSILCKYISKEQKKRRLKKLYRNLKYRKVNIMETIPENGNDIERAAFIPETIELSNAEEIFNTMN